MSEEEELEQLQEELDKIERGELNAGYPEPTKKDTLLTLFMKLVDAVKTTKFGNMTSAQIGAQPVKPVSYLHYAEFCRQFSNKDTDAYSLVAKYLDAQAEIAFSSSLSRDGVFVRLPFSQIKSLTMGNSKKGEAKKKGFFDRFRRDEPTGEQE